MKKMVILLAPIFPLMAVSTCFNKVIMSTSRIIKKYPNRRLYDTTVGEYITLEEIKKLVFDHVDFRVIDARTKKDLTQSTLLQIITEQETSSSPIFTTDMLQDFIRLYQEKSQNIL